MKNKQIYFETHHLKNVLSERAIKGGGLTLLARGISLVIQMMGTIVLARLLTPNDFGLVAMVASITGIFEVFKDLGLEDATIQSDNITQAQISTLFWLNVSFGSIIYFIIVLISPLIANFYSEPRLQLVAVVYSSGLVLTCMSSQHFALMRRGMHFEKIISIDLAAQFISTIGAIGFAIGGLGYWTLVIRPLMSAAISSLGAWLISKWRPSFTIHGKGVKTLFKFGLHNVAFLFTNWIGNQLDRPLIGWRSGAEILGYYDRAKYFTGLPVNQLVIPLHGIAVSTLSKLKYEPEKFYRYYLSAVSNLLIIGVPLSFFMVTMSREIVLLLLGSQWSKTASFFAILGICGSVNMLYGTLGWLHLGLGRADRQFRWGVIGNLFNALAICIGLPFGPLGVAISFTLAKFTLIGPALWYAGRPINLSVVKLFSEIFGYFVASLLAAAMCWTLSSILAIANHPLINLAVFFIVYLFAYLVFLVLYYRSFDPIKKFIALVNKMIPHRGLNAAIK